MWLCPSLQGFRGSLHMLRARPAKGQTGNAPPENFVRGLAENHHLWVTALAVSHTWSDCLEDIGIYWWKAQNEWFDFLEGIHSEVWEEISLLILWENLLAEMRQKEADVEQLGEVWCRPGRKQRSLMCWRKETDLLSGKKGGQWDGRLKGGRGLGKGRKVEGKPEVVSNSGKMD